MPFSSSFFIISIHFTDMVKILFSLHITHLLVIEMKIFITIFYSFICSLFLFFSSYSYLHLVSKIGAMKEQYVVKEGLKYKC